MEVSVLESKVNFAVWFHSRCPSLSYLGEVADISFKKLWDCLWWSIIIVLSLFTVPTTAIKTIHVDQEISLSQIGSEKFERDSQFRQLTIWACCPKIVTQWFSLAYQKVFRFLLLWYTIGSQTFDWYTRKISCVLCQLRVFTSSFDWRKMFVGVSLRALRLQLDHLDLILRHSIENKCIVLNYFFIEGSFWHNLSICLMGDGLHFYQFDYMGIIWNCESRA